MSINESKNKENITVVGKECKFAYHLPAIEGIRKDCHFIKETLHLSDGSTKPRLIRVLDFKRPFYITKKVYRKYNDKKEYEDLAKLDRFECTQSELPKKVGTKLEAFNWKNFTMRDVKKSPYVYGTDVSSTVLLKHLYQTRYKESRSTNSLAVLDIEADIDTGIIYLITVAMEDKVYTVINQSLLKNKHTDKNKTFAKLRQMFEKLVPDTDIKESVKNNITYDIVDNELDCIHNAFKIANIWMPDILAIWNINYDIPAILDRLDYYGIAPEKILTDQRIPKEYQFFKYVKGKQNKKMASGKFGTIPPQKQWHYGQGSMPFILLDAMCTYNYVREGQPEVVGGYGLSNILQLEIKQEKLKVEDTSKYQNADWHKHMVAEKPLEYVIYNQWDCLGMIELDNHTEDLKRSITSFSGINDYSYFNSGPTKIASNLHFEYLKYGVVIGTGGGDKDPDDERMTLSNWIAVLPSYRIVPDGLKVIMQDEDALTNIYAMVFDIDAVSSYPSNIQAANVSKATRITEVIAIDGIDVEEMKKININLVCGPVNALEYTNIMFGFPDLDYWDNLVV